MKTITNLLNLFTIIIALSSVAQAKPNGVKPNVDPAQLVCTIVFPDGQIIQGNGVNDRCLAYEDALDVEIFYHMASYPWIKYHNTEEFFCEVDNGKFMQIIKNVYRADEYYVKAFGHIYTSYGNQSSLGVANHLTVKNPTVEPFEPATIIFNSKFGTPTEILVHFQRGRAPESYKITCKQIL